MGAARPIWQHKHGWKRSATVCCCCKRVDCSSPALLRWRRVIHPCKERGEAGRALHSKFKSENSQLIAQQQTLVSLPSAPPKDSKALRTLFKLGYLAALRLVSDGSNTAMACARPRKKLSCLPPRPASASFVFTMYFIWFGTFFSHRAPSLQLKDNVPHTPVPSHVSPPTPGATLPCVRVQPCPQPTRGQPLPHYNHGDRGLPVDRLHGDGFGLQSKFENVVTRGTDSIAHEAVRIMRFDVL